MSAGSKGKNIQWGSVLLTSAGFFDFNGVPRAQIINKFAQMLGKSFNEARVLFIPTAATAGYPEIDESEHIRASMNELLMLVVLSENIVTYDIDGSLSLQEAMEFDVIFFIGGDPELLAERVQKTDFNKIILQMVYANKVYVGISAGSMLAMADFYAPVGIQCQQGDFTGLGLIDAFFSVHCEPGTVPRDDLPRPHIPLTDEQAIAVRWDGCEVI